MGLPVAPSCRLPESIETHQLWQDTLPLLASGTALQVGGPCKPCRVCDANVALLRADNADAQSSEIHAEMSKSRISGASSTDDCKYMTVAYRQQ